MLDSITYSSIGNFETYSNSKILTHAAEKKALQTPFAHSDPTTEPSSMAKGPQQKDGFFTFLVRGTSMGTGTTSASRQP